ISRTDMAWPAIMTSPTSRFGTRGFSSGSHRIEEFLSFRSSPIGSGPAARLAVLFSMKGNGSTLVRAPNTWKSIVRSRTVGDPVMSRIWSGRFVWQRVPKWPRARSFPDFFPSARIAPWATTPSSRTQFCGQTQKLLPKVACTVVLSAPTERSAASIATSTSNYENRSARSTNPDAFSAFRCRGNKDRADQQRRIGPEILSYPLLAGPDAHSGEIPFGARRKPALCPDRGLSRCPRHSGAEDLFSRPNGRSHLDRRFGRKRSLQLSPPRMACPPRVLRIGARSNRDTSCFAGIGLRRNEEAFARRIQRRALRLGTELLFRKLSRTLFWHRHSAMAWTRSAAAFAQNRGTAGAFAQS